MADRFVSDEESGDADDEATSTPSVITDDQAKSQLLSEDEATSTPTVSTDEQADSHQVSEDEDGSPYFPCREKYCELMNADKKDELLGKQMRYILEGPPRKKRKRCDEMAPSTDAIGFKVASMKWVELSIERVLKYYRTMEEDLYGMIMTPEGRAVFSECHAEWAKFVKKVAQNLSTIEKCVALGEEAVEKIEEGEKILEACREELNHFSDNFRGIKRDIIKRANESREKQKDYFSKIQPYLK